MKRKIIISVAALGLAGLAAANVAQAFNFGNMMNPSRWFDSDRDRYMAGVMTGVITVAMVVVPMAMVALMVVVGVAHMVVVGVALWWRGVDTVPMVVMVVAIQAPSW